MRNIPRYSDILLACYIFIYVLAVVQVGFSYLAEVSKYF